MGYGNTIIDSAAGLTARNFNEQVISKANIAGEVNSAARVSEAETVGAQVEVPTSVIAQRPEISSTTRLDRR